MASSAVPAAKAGLLSVLQAAPGLSSLVTADAVEWGHPEDRLRHEHVWMGDTRFEPEASRVGNVSHRERFVIPVVVFVLKEGGTAQAAEERWYELVGEIEDAVRADASLASAAGVNGAVVSGKEPHAAIHPKGRVHEGAVLVTCTARI